MAGISFVSVGKVGDDDNDNVEDGEGGGLR
jgi:hypothetical protein